MEEKTMLLGGFKRFIAIFFVLILVSVFLASTVIAKQVEPNPGIGPVWFSGTIWGTNLRFENRDNTLSSANTATISEVWYGVGATGYALPAPPDPGAGIIIELLDNEGTNQFESVQAAVTGLASYTWQVQFRKVNNSDPDGGKVSSTMGDSENDYVPQNFSVVLENTDLGIYINLRAGAENIHGTNIRANPILAALNIDNAVNVTISPSSRGGKTGDNVSFTVTVNNTGRYDDNYSLGVNASGLQYTISPTVLSVKAGNSANATLTVTVGTSNRIITVTADGEYADSNTSCTAEVTGETLYILTATVNPTSGGSITLNPSSDSYSSGTVVTATATPASGYVFDHWSGDASGTTATVTVTMDSDKTITAIFEVAGAGNGLPWAWVVVGVVIVVIIIVSTIGATRMRPVSAPSPADSPNM
jgi:uncharacterized repeat protein (TIGR02543 family)